jgi:hypothetical protein
MKEIIENSLNEDPQAAYMSQYIATHDMWSPKLVQADAMKWMHEDQISNSSIDAIMAEIRG